MTKRKFDGLFDVGDRVVGNGVQNSINLSGLHGVVVAVHDRERRYSVCFDEYGDLFHTCGGMTDEGHGWFCDEDVLSPEEDVHAEIGARLPELSLLLM